MPHASSRVTPSNEESPSRGIRSLVRLGLLLGALAIASPGHATTFQVEFTGVVASVGADLVGGPISQGSDVSGRFIYESPSPRIGPDFLGIYEDAVTLHEASIAGYDVSLVGTTSISIGNDQPSIPSPYDSVIVNSFDLSGATINGLSPVRLQFGLFSMSDLTKVLTTDLPHVDDLLRFDASDGQTNFNFLDFGIGFSGQVRWNLTSFTPTVIPEPGTAILLGGGLMALASRRRTLR